MTPILLASIGEIIAERSGIVNIGIEGIMLISAFIAVAIIFATESIFVGLTLGLATGALLGLIHGILAVYFRSDQIVSGIALNIIAYGFTVLGLVGLWGAHGASPRIGVHTPYFKIGLYTIPYISIIALIIAVLAWYLLFNTRLGLAIRACGEDPKSAEAMGVNVNIYRVIATTTGGALTGLAGAFLAVEIVGQFVRGMTAGRGFIALANVAFSGWNPLLALAGAYIFGLLESVSVLSQQLSLEYAYIARTIPYIGTLLVVIIFAWRAQMPRSLAKPYIKE